jgi:hypothetical protein
LPRNASRVSGRLLSQKVAPASEGSSPCTGIDASPACMAVAMSGCQPSRVAPPGLAPSAIRAIHAMTTFDAPRRA